MHRGYEDIHEKLGEPLWYDEHGVPRYREFSPNLCGVYNRYVALVEIACQRCDRLFKVAVERGLYNEIAERQLPTPDNDWYWHYGDPPVHGCVGDTMNTIEKRVIEFWDHSNAIEDWKRVPKYEIEFNS